MNCIFMFIYMNGCIIVLSYFLLILYFRWLFYLRDIRIFFLGDNLIVYFCFFVLIGLFGILGISFRFGYVCKVWMIV